MLALQLAGMQVSPLAIVRSILSLFSGSLYLPSPSSCYQDTAGTLPCVVDTPVGLLLDEMRTFGPELVTNGDFSAGTTGWSGSGSGGWLISGGAASHSATAIGELQYSGILADGKMYRVEFDILASSGASGSVQLGGAGGGIYSWTAGSVGRVSVLLIAASTGALNAVRFYNNASAVSTIDNISVREVTGIHATQATAGFKPILRGNVKNYLLNSATLSTQNVTCPLVPMTLSIYGTGSVTLSGGATGVLTGTGAGNRVTLTFTPTVALVTFTVAGSVTSGQLELGTVANPYVPTGATVASSSYGPYRLDFDGIQTRMQLTAVPFQMSDDHFVVVSGVSLSNATARTIFSSGSTASATPSIRLGYTTLGYAQATWTDDAGVTATITGTTNLLGTPHVIAMTKQGNSKKLYVNNVQIGATDTTVMGATTLNQSLIGARVGLTTSEFASGNINIGEIGKGTISDAQLLTISRYAGQQVGVTI